MSKVTYILAEYTKLGLKVPRIVHQKEAQAYYDRKCRNAGLDPSDLSVADHSSCIVDDAFHEYLWIVVEP
jgi:hypothetical protein